MIVSNRPAFCPNLTLALRMTSTQWRQQRGQKVDLSCMHHGTPVSAEDQTNGPHPGGSFPLLLPPGSAGGVPEIPPLEAQYPFPGLGKFNRNECGFTARSHQGPQVSPPDSRRPDCEHVLWLRKLRPRAQVTQLVFSGEQGPTCSLGTACLPGCFRGAALVTPVGSLCADSPRPSEVAVLVGR